MGGPNLEVSMLGPPFTTDFQCLLPRVLSNFKRVTERSFSIPSSAPAGADSSSQKQSSGRTLFVSFPETTSRPPTITEIEFVVISTLQSLACVSEGQRASTTMSSSVCNHLYCSHSPPSSSGLRCASSPNSSIVTFSCAASRCMRACRCSESLIIPSSDLSFIPKISSSYLFQLSELYWRRKENNRNNGSRTANVVISTRCGFCCTSSTSIFNTHCASSRTVVAFDTVIVHK
mmetsp:Transcript_45065/g.86179  ORF Transcript_45065/g.86179 Transcript_45065/m.86179 type:complete len:232 (+) Transcript_45065:389-1084(+)